MGPENLSTEECASGDRKKKGLIPACAWVRTVTTKRGVWVQIARSDLARRERRPTCISLEDGAFIARRASLQPNAAQHHIVKEPESSTFDNNSHNQDDAAQGRSAQRHQ
jgi:hypothetical protein